MSRVITRRPPQPLAPTPAPRSPRPSGQRGPAGDARGHPGRARHAVEETPDLRCQHAAQVSLEIAPGGRQAHPGHPLIGGVRLALDRPAALHPLEHRGDRRGREVEHVPELALGCPFVRGKHPQADRLAGRRLLLREEAKHQQVVEAARPHEGAEDRGGPGVDALEFEGVVRVVPDRALVVAVGMHRRNVSTRTVSVRTTSSWSRKPRAARAGRWSVRALFGIIPGLRDGALGRGVAQLGSAHRSGR